VTVLLGVDLGKTGCRAQRDEDGVRGPVVEGDGAPGLADPGGAEQATAAVEAVAAAALGHRTADAVVVGAAGAEAAPGAADRLATRLAGLLGAPVAVASDSVTAHAGALGGSPGTVLAVGTGSVALGMDAEGRHHQVDGWGPVLGDDGSGGWLGRAGLRAVLRARDGRGVATALTERAVERFGDLDALPGGLHASGAWARTVASFARDVLDAAAEGDAVADALLDAAADLWVDLAVAAAAAVGESRVTVVGGLASADALTRRFAALLPAGLRLVPALGTGLDGALLLAARADLPHEAHLRGRRSSPPS